MAKTQRTVRRVITRPTDQVNTMIFRDAEKVRDAITAHQKREIAALYEKWADEIGHQADLAALGETFSDLVKEGQLRDLQRKLEATSVQVMLEVERKIKANMFTVASATVMSNNRWLQKLGLIPAGERAISMAFSNVPDQVIRRLVTGQVYEGGWNLSKSIWGDNRKTMQSIYEIIAAGKAQNKSIYEISKQLEQYVRPSARKPWNLRNAQGRLIYPKQVDYNAQRLARTLLQHSYQQSVIEMTKANPFVKGIKWVSNGSRVCELCLSRNGNIYTPEDIPQDHPNGMCVFPLVTESATEIGSRWGRWAVSDEGDYPEMDAFARRLGVWH